MCLCVEENRNWELDPFVPKTNDELWTKLAKSYAGHIKLPGCTKMSYRDMVTITVMA